ncbi:NADP-dependent oxidoreductase [Kibdelosporangium lantanae]
MRALRFHEYGPPSVLRVDDIPEPHAGPGQVRVAVRASGVGPGDTYRRSGRVPMALPGSLPAVLGFDAAGVVDEVGPGVTGTAVGDAVFGMVDIAVLGGANAEYAVLAAWAPKPDSLSWAEVGGIASTVETATRVLDLLEVGDGTTLLIEGAAGAVGTVAVQLAVARGAKVIGTGSPGTHALLTGLGAVPTEYGPGLRDRVSGVDVVMDCVGSGSLRDLVAIAGDPSRVVTIADLNAFRYGVRMSRTAGGPGADPQALHGLAAAASLASEGRFTVPLAGVFPLEDAVAAHELSETGHAHGKIVLTTAVG